MEPLTRAQSREIDRLAMERYSMPSIVLMENAGRGCAELLQKLGIRGRVVICCGGGNKGGDGLVMARHLENAGVEVAVVLFADEAKVGGDAAVNLRILRAAGTPLLVCSGAKITERATKWIQEGDWVVDALLGTGVSGPVREPLAGVIAAINAQAKRVLAIDIPSGLDCDSGRPWGTCVRADHTATMVAPKVGFAVAAEWTGVVHVVDIGIPHLLLTSLGS